MDENYNKRIFEDNMDNNKNQKIDTQTKRNLTEEENIKLSNAIENNDILGINASNRITEIENTNSKYSNINNSQNNKRESSNIITFRIILKYMYR